MKSSNSLFLDTDYKYDCEHKIDYFHFVENGTINTQEVVSTKPDSTSFKQISTNLYKYLETPPSNS